MATDSKFIKANGWQLVVGTAITVGVLFLSAWAISKGWNAGKK